LFEYLGSREFDRVTCVSGTEHNSIEQSEEDKDFMTHEVPTREFDRVTCVSGTEHNSIKQSEEDKDFMTHEVDCSRVSLTCWCVSVEQSKTQ
jgi:hypothetical protein